MGTLKRGASPEKPFQLRPGATLPFYVATKDWLTAGDTLATAVWVVPATLTKSGETIPAVETTLGGVAHPANTLAQVTFADSDVGKMYECEVTLTTTNGLIDPRSVWVLGVKNYS